MKSQIEILNKLSIDRKIMRMAYQIWELNHNEKEIVLIGIKDCGLVLANRLGTVLKEISPLGITILEFSLNKQQPLHELPSISENLNNKAVILVDDVSNSGKTLTYAMKPVLDYNPSKILIAVLVDRQHKVFPISPDIVGHALATTIQDSILINYKGKEILSAHLV